MNNLTRILLLFIIPLFYNSCKKETVPGDENLSLTKNSEKHRPQFHFTPPEMWMNDPNGMVYLNGEYHLFYQHYPDSTIWGPMHWGHAVSKHLLEWEHLPIALYPDSLGYIFSGSAVFDERNTSGLGSKENPPLVAIYTYHNVKGEKAGEIDYQTQGIAYSVDSGRNWEKYQDNPVLDNPGIKDFRDPKVFWHDETSKWVMILAVDDHVEMFGSKNLKSWYKLSEFGKTAGAHGGVWECPDLFPLPVDDKDLQKWVMLLSINPGGLYGGSATQYFVGDFDGETFKNDNPDQTLWLDYGKDNYAGVTWSNIPESDGRRIFMGWMSNWQYAQAVPTIAWRSAMTLPRSLHLKTTNDGIRLVSLPVKEINGIRNETHDLQEQKITGKIEVTDMSFEVTTSEMIFEFELTENASEFGVELFNGLGQSISVGFNASRNSFYVDRTNSGNHNFSEDFGGIHYAPRISRGNTIKMHLFFDVASVELFADDGTAVITDIFFPDELYKGVRLFSNMGTVKLKSGKITELNSIGLNSLTDK